MGAYNLIFVEVATGVTLEIWYSMDYDDTIFEYYLTDGVYEVFDTKVDANNVTFYVVKTS